MVVVICDSLQIHGLILSRRSQLWKHGGKLLSMGAVAVDKAGYRYSWPCKGVHMSSADKNRR